MEPVLLQKCMEVKKEIEDMIESRELLPESCSFSRSYTGFFNCINLPNGAYGTS